MMQLLRLKEQHVGKVQLHLEPLQRFGAGAPDCFPLSKTAGQLISGHWSFCGFWDLDLQTWMLHFTPMTKVSD